jgi:predicted SnoaL-like aldol condensation-catalyzing enzyme
LIVEHWDNLQETAKPNPSGHTMIDGATTVSNIDRTEENKKLVRQFVDDILVNGKMDKLAAISMEITTSSIILTYPTTYPDWVRL